MSNSSAFSRRRMLGLMAGVGAATVLSACGQDDETEQTIGDVVQAPTTIPAPTPTEEPEETPTAAEPTPTEAAPTPIPEATEAVNGEEEAQIIVDDVIDFALDSGGDWEGPFGWVTLKLHQGFFEGEEVWFIRTDASDETFATDHGLVHVPLMRNALNAPESYANLYLFENGADNQVSVVTTIPELDNYTSAFLIHNVTFNGDSELLTSESDIRAAEDRGAVTIEETEVIVNYPLVVWPGGGLPVDTELVEPLGMGPLVEEADLDTGEVTFKLHECFPGSRYIVTDTSAVPMAPMMGIVGAAPTQLLKDVFATAPITIFLNGLTGPGVMGFQPAIFNTSAGHPSWSPFWDHFAAEWVDPDQATVVRSQEELDQLVAAGDLILYNGVPDTHPDGFVVNCPAPILAPNSYTGE